MGRHKVGGSRRSARATPWLVALGVLLVAAGLGWWWVGMRSASDPVDANPVPAYAEVVSSPPCAGAGAGGATVVQISGPQAGRTTINACGYASGQRIAVEYLAGHPDVARLAGTSTATPPSLASRLLPIAILVAGVLAFAAAIWQLIGRRRRDSGGPVTVTELRAAMGRAAPDVVPDVVPVPSAAVVAVHLQQPDPLDPPATTVHPVAYADDDLFTHRRTSDLESDTQH